MTAKMDRLYGTRRRFLRAVGLGAASWTLAGGLGLGTAPGRERRRPNVVFLFTDDQRFDTIHALGNEQIITPNLDGLVRNGTSFTNAYIMGSMAGAVCMPSRAMLLTGRTLFHLEKLGVNVPPGHTTFPEVFRNAGYTTFQTGKWHQDAKTYNRCFTTGAKLFFGGMSDHFNVPVRDYDPTGRYPKQAVYSDRDKHSSELFSDAAIQFLKGYTEDKPFLMYISYTAPHDPRHMPPKYLAMYDPADMELPKSYLPEHPFNNGEMKIRDENLAPWPRTPEEVRKHQAAYYAMITHVDTQIGRVLETLRATGHADDTIIIFSADNGLAVGRHGLLGKQNLYEHSVHVPLIFCGPGIPKGRKCDVFCYLLDIYPTLCDLAGLPRPTGPEGQSLAPALRGQDQDRRESLFFAYKNIQRAVRQGRFKLIEYHVGGARTTQLFDLENDPWELKNLARDSRYAQQLQDLRKRLVQWQEELDDNGSFWPDSSS